MANTGIQVANVNVANSVSVGDRVVMCMANGAVRLTPVSNTVVLLNVTPANSTVNCNFGQLFFDSNYLYIATANNNLKRVALTTF